MANLNSVTDASFENDVLKAEMPTLVDFWAEWCGPCKAMAPHLEHLAEEQAEKLRLVQMDVQDNPDTAARLGVLNIPTLILFIDGEEKTRLSGFAPLPKIVEKLFPHLPS